jgi:hypothetical protein
VVVVVGLARGRERRGVDKGSDCVRAASERSAGHAVFVDGVLVQVRHLINGRTIVHERVDEVASTTSSWRRGWANYVGRTALTFRSFRYRQKSDLPLSTHQGRRGMP